MVGNHSRGPARARTSAAVTGRSGRGDGVEAPTLVVWGRQDALVPVAYAAEFGSRIAGSRVEVIDDCGHVLQADQPERTWAAVSGFLAG